MNLTGYRLDIAAEYIYSHNMPDTNNKPTGTPPPPPAWVPPKNNPGTNHKGGQAK